MSDDDIRAAHAKEIHPANALVNWTQVQLDSLPGRDDDINIDALELNVLARVIYSDGADFPMPMPLDDRTMRVARQLSEHADVDVVALYQVDWKGDNDALPSAAFVNGESVGS
jgi:hypothetical protein